MQEFNRVVRDTFVALATCSLLFTACGDSHDDHDHGTCDPVCAEGEHCHDGTCEPHVEVCDPACAEGEHCHDGKCEPKPVEATNQCTGDDDLAKIQAGDPNGAATTCGLGCLANGDPATCSMECVTTETGLSEGCAGCYVETIVCTIDNCVGDCAVDPSSDACTTCQNDSGCIERFYACSGLPQSVPCDPACADGETCTDGACVADPVTCDPACADGETCTDGTCVAPPALDPPAYTFVNGDGDSTVKYTGQTHRNVLIYDIKAFIGGMDAAIKGGLTVADGDFFASVDAEGNDVPGMLDKWLNHSTDAGDGEEAITFTSHTPFLQTKYSDISSKSLMGKLAGNDGKTDHKCWSTKYDACATATPAFGGWSDASVADNGGGIDTPVHFLKALLETLEAQAIMASDGKDILGPGDMKLPVHVTPAGHDLQQLIQKFLSVSIAYSQGTDDYLDDDVDGKGLKASNLLPRDENGVATSVYSSLAHAWDEGFGYYGASTFNDEFSDSEVAGKGGDDGARADWLKGHDRDGDGYIDLKTEYNFGFSLNAAKRDRGSKKVGTAPTDFSKQIFDAFVAGRQLLHDNWDKELTTDQLDELTGYRNDIIDGWEKALVATVVHYINDTLEQANWLKDGDAQYDFLEYAVVWSEMKGFALGLQYNPKSGLTDAEFDTLHVHLKDAPVLDATTVGDYITLLEGARDLLQGAYSFNADNAKNW